MTDNRVWPLHEYDPRPAHRRTRRAWAVFAEHLRRELEPIADRILHTLARIGRRLP